VFGADDIVISFFLDHLNSFSIEHSFMSEQILVIQGISVGLSSLGNCISILAFRGNIIGIVLFLEFPSVFSDIR